MKYRYTVFLLILFVFIAAAEAQLFRPFTSFRVIRTEHFDIIFPLESEPSARLLATYADNVYQQLSSILGISLPGRIPVTFAPHTELFNGYFRSIPGPSIMLFDTPMDLEWTSFENSLKGLFVHELVHAITLNARSNSFNILHRIFGSWVSPAILNSPPFMVEGVAITFESLAGFGRANDPRVRQILRQAIHEGRFLSPFQTSAVFDLPGQGGAWYDYGALFSAWLIQNYGMEKYAELWQAKGRLSLFSFFKYRSGFYRIFRRIYGMDFLDAWNAFRDSLALDSIEENPYEILPVNRRFSSENRSSIFATAAAGDDVFVLSRPGGRIHVYNTLTGNVRKINSALMFCYDLDVNSDGTLLLVSGYQTTGERHSAIVVEQRADSGRRTGRVIRGLYRARYFRDGVIGIRSQLHNPRIVFEDFDGNSKILFKGSPERLFTGPQALDDERIVFVASRKGVRELMLFNFVSEELFRIECYSGDNRFWRYMRSLGVSDGKLFFSHNIDDRMYRLASIDLDTKSAVFSKRDFSGGVFLPVSVNGFVYYRANFFSGDGFLRFPEASDSLTGKRIDIRLVRVDGEDFGMTVGQTSAGVDSPPLYTGPSSRYFGIRYMNPFNFWLPLPLIRLSDRGDGIRPFVDGGGFITAMMDPTDRNLVILTAYADAVNRMAVIDSFSWRTTVPGFPLTAEFSDRVIESVHGPFRDTRVSLSGSFTRNPGRVSYGISLGGTYARFADYDGGASAYRWEKTDSVFLVFAGLVFSNNQRRRHELFGNGVSLSLRGVSTVGTPFRPRFEGVFRANRETLFPVNLTLYGAYDKWGMNIHGVSRRYGQPLFASVASAEYAHPQGLELTWIAGGEASAGIFSFEIQRYFSHLYFNRIYGVMTMRSIVYNSQGHPDAEGTAFGDIRHAQSLVFRLGAVLSILPAGIPVFIEPVVWGSWNFSNTITGRGSPFSYGFTWSIRY